MSKQAEIATSLWAELAVMNKVAQGLTLTPKESKLHKTLLAEEAALEAELAAVKLTDADLLEMIKCPHFQGMTVADAVKEMKFSRLREKEGR